MRLVLDDAFLAAPREPVPMKFDRIVIYDPATGERIGEWASDWPWPTRDKPPGKTFTISFDGDAGVARVDV